MEQIDPPARVRRRTWLDRTALACPEPKIRQHHEAAR